MTDMIVAIIIYDLSFDNEYQIYYSLSPTARTNLHYNDLFQQ